jgi:glycosyltransferase involved in cell wall biosynthesis
MRDRHLRTIRDWSSVEVCNPELAHNRIGAQVKKTSRVPSVFNTKWMGFIPVLNIKRRPPGAPKDAVLYIWGGLATTGKFITELDNPWSLVGYNVRAMTLYKKILKKFLLSSRCIEIRCISEACRASLMKLFGSEVYKKSTLVYPKILPKGLVNLRHTSEDGCRFLFIGTQFLLKGGASLLRAYRELVKHYPNSQLTMITHLPDDFSALVKSIPNLTVVPPDIPVDEIRSQYMCQSDVLVHPSFMESFGMVLLEGLSCGVAIIGTDMYASNEMILNETNGYLISPPITAWDNYEPTENFMVHKLLANLSMISCDDFENALMNSMSKLANNATLRNKMKAESSQLFNKKFSS